MVPWVVHVVQLKKRLRNQLKATYSVGNGRKVLSTFIRGRNKTYVGCESVRHTKTEHQNVIFSPIHANTRKLKTWGKSQTLGTFWRHGSSDIQYGVARIKISFAVLACVQLLITKIFRKSLCTLQTYLESNLLFHPTFAWVINVIRDLQIPGPFK